MSKPYITKKYYSRIESLSITGGYLDSLNINFSEHLNTVIGGRGTGKSTLLECIRYALELEPIGKSARKQHFEIIKENIGKSKARIEMVIRSSKMNGKKFIIARRYGESSSVKDDNGVISSFTPGDLMPEIEIYGQNEIYEIALDNLSQKKLLKRYLKADHDDNDAKIQEIMEKLRENRIKQINARNDMASVETELSQLPKLEERVKQFQSLGLEEKLKIIPHIEIEKRLNQRIKEELIALKQSFENIKDTFPDTVFLSDKALKDLPHASILKEIKLKLDELTTTTETIVNQWLTSFSLTQDQIKALSDSLRSEIQSTEGALEKTFKDLPSSEGKSGSEIGHEFQQLLKQIEYIKPKKKSIEAHQRLVSELNQQRKALLSELSECRADRTAHFNRSLKKLNKQLDGKLKLSITPEADKKPVVDFLLKCNLENVAQARLAWINEADDFSTVRLAELIQQGNNALSQSNWGITPTVVNALIKMNLSHVMQLQELELPDIIEIQLNVAHSGEEKFRLLEKLSRGQQCTAILHLLLLKNSDPLIMDQPEDNLDNAFIADRIVAELRNEKINRQFIFATHNANIPVFGDAEWIGIFESSDDQASMPKEAQGGIDVETIREMSANILEGGKTAFNQRKLKYGY